MSKEEKDLLKIGEFAERGDISRRSLRHYEELGILTPERRTSGGFRLYEENDLFKLEIIKVFKELGFSLKEIKKILDRPREEPIENRGAHINYSQDVLRNQLTEVSEKLEKLKKRQELIEGGLEALEECRDCSADSCPSHCDNRRYFL
ncbi:MAG: MerR family transcriptional regulator [Candidatus Bipolaricaulota bacterium]